MRRDLVVFMRVKYERDYRKVNANGLDHSEVNLQVLPLACSGSRLVEDSENRINRVP